MRQQKKTQMATKIRIKNIMEREKQKTKNQETQEETYL